VEQAVQNVSLSALIFRRSSASYSRRRLRSERRWKASPTSLKASSDATLGFLSGWRSSASFLYCLRMTLLFAKGSAPSALYQSGAARTVSEVTASDTPARCGHRRCARFAYLRADLALFEALNLDSAMALRRSASDSGSESVSGGAIEIGMGEN